MGHIRLGRLPKTRRWSEVISLLGAPSAEPAEIAASILEASQSQLMSLGHDPAFRHNYWLLTQITTLARGKQFKRSLAQIGIELPDSENLFDLISAIGRQAELRTVNKKHYSALSTIAHETLKETLTRALTEETQSMFDSDLRSVKDTLKAFSTKTEFARLSRIFFSTYLNRYLQFFASKEISNQIGEEHGFTSIGDVVEFDKAVRNYCFESARIVEDFAGGWYSKMNWRGGITEADVGRFVHVALKKLRAEFAVEVN